jgi:hypothetical protein
LHVKPPSKARGSRLEGNEEGLRARRLVPVRLRRLANPSHAKRNFRDNGRQVAAFASDMFDADHSEQILSALAKAQDHVVVLSGRLSYVSDAYLAPC